jgi:hypothetical protein
MPTLIIFDWDDTLFCTSAVLPNPLLPLEIKDTHTKMEVEELETYIYTLLTKALELGTVIIVTNGQEGWVELCCSRIYKRIEPLLQQIKVVSARSLHEKEYPHNYFHWKCLVFKDIIDHPTTTTYTNVISIGDSEYERFALNYTKILLDYGVVYTKSIKLLDTPTIVNLQRQIIYLIHKIRHIVECDRDMDVQTLLDTPISHNF